MAFRLFAKRAFSSPAKQFPSYEHTMLREAYDARLHAVGSVKNWFYINVFLVVPTLIGVAFYTIPQELKHMEHLEHHPNEYVAFQHLRKRKNPFPWGDDSLFHNPNANARPPREE